MPRKTKLSKKTPAIRDVEAEAECRIIRTLRTLSNEEAFYFYESPGKPTGLSAKSLREFLDHVECVKLESLVFHLERDDFTNWIAKTLDDPTLSRRIQMIPVENNGQLRLKICETVRARLAELEGASIQAISL